MRLPEVADRLRELAVQHSLPELALLADEIRRRPPQRRTERRVSKPLGPALRAAIRVTALTYPQLTQLEIARTFQVSQGRVSEILRGKRE